MIEIMSKNHDFHYPFRLSFFHQSFSEVASSVSGPHWSTEKNDGFFRIYCGMNINNMARHLSPIGYRINLKIHTLSFFQTLKYKVCLYLFMENNQTKVGVICNEDIHFNNPIVIGGFIGQTTLGVTTTSYIIEQFGLHEVAKLKSHQIAPVTVFVGGKMRSPFRIYSNDKGTLMIIQCEVPVDIEGLYEITETLMDWIKPFNPKEFVIIDGVPVEDLPEEREAYLVAGLERIESLKSTGIAIAEAALIGGMGGAILNESILTGQNAIALLTNVSVAIPDHDAVLSVIKALNAIYKLGIKTAVLEESVKKIHEEISKVASEYKAATAEQDSVSGPDSIYR